MMQWSFYVVSANTVGTIVSVQAPMNAVLARSIGSAIAAAAISIGIAFRYILAALAVTGSCRITGHALRSVPWWIYLAGAAGTVFVVAGTITAPGTGALAFFVSIVAGQPVGSTLADHFGVLGVEVLETTPVRLIGIAIVLLGAIIASRWWSRWSLGYGSAIGGAPRRMKTFGRCDRP